MGSLSFGPFVPPPPQHQWIQRGGGNNVGAPLCKGPSEAIAGSLGTSQLPAALQGNLLSPATLPSIPSSEST